MGEWKYVVKWADVEELSPMSDVEPISGEPHSFVPKFPTVGQASKNFWRP